MASFPCPIPRTSTGMTCDIGNIGVGTGGGGYSPPNILEGGLSPLHLQPSIVTIQTSKLN